MYIFIYIYIYEYMNIYVPIYIYIYIWPKPRLSSACCFEEPLNTHHVTLDTKR